MKKYYKVYVLVQHIYKPVELEITAHNEEEAKEKAEEVAKDRAYLSIQSTETEILSISKTEGEKE